MPGKVGVKIKAGRNLPVMDRSSDTTDAYVEIKLGSVTHKTDVCRKSLNPQWNTDWFRFEVDDAELQDEPLQIRLMDYDTYSANDAIGKVNISLNPLCLETSGQATHGKGTVLSGWIPVFDTMHGIRGEVNLIVKVDLFSDLNKFRQSSCGIPFFHSQCIPHGYRAQIIHGFVEELVVNDDPEYQWIDKIRTPRASNEARQVVFLKLSGQVQRKMGLKAINMGANAVIGYTQCFDLEGDVGVVARGIGTAVTLMKDTNSQPAAADNALIEERTLKYLEFLTGSTVGLFELPHCQLQIRKSRSSTLFELKRRPSELDDSEIMVDLMRQEDERGEKPVKKLRHHMKRFTHTSRNMLNEKYNSFMRIIVDNVDSKSPKSTSRSLTSLFSSTSGFIKEESGSSMRSATVDVRRRPSCKAKHKVAAAKPLVPRHSLKKGAHPIVRSVSDDSAMKYNTDGARKAKVPLVNEIAEYQDSTRSSPNISAEEQQRLAREQEEFDELNTSPTFGIASDDGSGIDIVATARGRRFGEFSKHAPHRRLKGSDADTALSCSSNTLSMTVSDSSSSEAEAESKVPANDVERVKVEKFLKICNLDETEDEKMDEKWIKPSDLDGVDDSLPELRQRRSLLRDLKVFSQHVQDFLHKPKKTTTAAAASHAIGLPLSGITGLVALQPVPLGERISYYSSQPEICIDYDVDMLAPPSSQITHSRSLINLSQSVSAYANPAAFSLQLDVKAAARDNLFCNNASTSQCSPSDSLPLTICQLQPSKCPVLQICPSTPTPTPSESDNSQLSPGEAKARSVVDCDLPAVVAKLVAPTPPAVTASVAAYTSSSSSPPNECVYVANNSLLSPLANTTWNTITVSSSQSPRPSTSPQPKLLNANTNTNHSNINSSLLAPTPPPLTSSPSPSLLSLTPSSPPSASPLFGIKHHTRHRHRNRSLNEISAPPVTALSSISGVTDSPSMKRFASPASAAVVAAAATGPSGATTNPSTASLVSNQRGKLSPSPSKLAINLAATGAATAPTAVVNSAQSQGDSASSSVTTATSIATTVIPKETSEMCRRSSDSDLSVTPKGNSLCVASERLVAATAMMRLSQPITGKNATTDGLDMLEYPFLTMTKYPPGFILHLGATVAARSVKLLERVPNPDEPEVRDSWWTELRMEIRSHARALGCNVVLGYSEATTISDDVCVLSATGTAAVINMAYNRSVSQTDILTMTKPTVGSAAAVGISAVGGGGGGGVSAMSASLEERDMPKDVRNGAVNEAVVAATKESMSSLVGATAQSGGGSAGKKSASMSFNLAKNCTCTVCHIPYNLSSVPFNVKMKKCAICRKGRVPDVLLATLEVPEYLHVTGRGCFMQAQVVRAKKDLRSELNAKEISDGLPFLEYELHRVLINKLKAKGMNAIFGLRAQVAIGERMIALIATGTALFLTALPVPQVPKIVAGNSWTDKQKLNELQKKLQETFERNQEIYQLKCIDPDVMVAGGGDKQSDTDESDDEVIEIDLNCGNKDTCVLEVDDIEDLEIISLLMEPYPPEGFHVVNTQSVPGMVDMEAVKNLQMFTQVWRAKLDVGQNISGFPKHFQRLLQTIYFKLRTMIPCAICDLRFRLDLPESDQIQLLVTGMALGLGDANKFKYRRKTYAGNGPNEASNNAQVSQPPEVNGTQGNKRSLQEEDYIFPLDEDQVAVETPTPTSNLPPYGMHSFKLCKTSPSRLQSKANAASRNRFFPLRDRYGVDITPLSFVPGGRIDKYLGNLNFFFIRETTSIRENGGISGFVHSFITELLAVVRAHIAALGGNAMVSFYMTELILVDNQHKNQGQCLISIGGDAVYVSYYTDD